MPVGCIISNLATWLVCLTIPWFLPVALKSTCVKISPSEQKMVLEYFIEVTPLFSRISEKLWYKEVNYHLYIFLFLPIHIKESISWAFFFLAHPHQRHYSFPIVVYHSALCTFIILPGQLCYNTKTYITSLCTLFSESSTVYILWLIVVEQSVALFMRIWTVPKWRSSVNFCFDLYHTARYCYADFITFW